MLRNPNNFNIINISMTACAIYTAKGVPNSQSYAILSHLAEFFNAS